MPVWDLPVRVLHWTLALAFGLCWLTTLEAFAPIGPWHQPAGWLGAVAVLLRLAWGFAAPGPHHRHARLASFVHGPRAVWAYARRVATARAPRYLGHNPLGAWMALALWSALALLTLTGWLYTTDAWFGDEDVEALHLAAAYLMGALVPLHVAGVVHTGSRHRENLVAAMLHGRKRAPAPEDVD